MKIFFNLEILFKTNTSIWGITHQSSPGIQLFSHQLEYNYTSCHYKSDLHKFTMSDVFLFLIVASHKSPMAIKNDFSSQESVVHW